MSEAAAVIVEDDPALESDFAREMVRQMRAIDTYGSYDDWPVAKILKPFVLTKQMRREIPVVGASTRTTAIFITACQPISDVSPKAIICSMTVAERRNHLIINGSRRKRIANGSGVGVSEGDYILAVNGAIFNPLSATCARSPIAGQ